MKLLVLYVYRPVASYFWVVRPLPKAVHRAVQRRSNPREAWKFFFTSATWIGSRSTFVLCTIYTASSNLSVFQFCVVHQRHLHATQTEETRPTHGMETGLTRAALLKAARVSPVCIPCVGLVSSPWISSFESSGLVKAWEKSVLHFNDFLCHAVSTDGSQEGTFSSSWSEKVVWPKPHRPDRLLRPWYNNKHNYSMQ